MVKLVPLSLILCKLHYVHFNCGFNPQIYILMYVMFQWIKAMFIFLKLCFLSQRDEPVWLNACLVSQTQITLRRVQAACRVFSPSVTSQSTAGVLYFNFDLAWAQLKSAKVQEVCLPWSSASSHLLFLFLSLCNQHRLLQEMCIWVNLTKTCPSHVNNNNNDDDSDNKIVNNDKCYYYKIMINTYLYNCVIGIILELNINYIINKYFSIEIIFYYFMH